MVLSSSSPYQAAKMILRSNLISKEMSRGVLESLRGHYHGDPPANPKENRPYTSMKYWLSPNFAENRKRVDPTQDLAAFRRQVSYGSALKEQLTATSNYVNLLKARFEDIHRISNAIKGKYHNQDTINESELTACLADLLESETEGTETSRICLRVLACVAHVPSIASLIITKDMFNIKKLHKNEDEGQCYIAFVQSLEDLISQRPGDFKQKRAQIMSSLYEAYLQWYDKPEAAVLESCIGTVASSQSLMFAAMRLFGVHILGASPYTPISLITQNHHLLSIVLDNCYSDFNRYLSALLIISPRNVEGLANLQDCYFAIGDQLSYDNTVYPIITIPEATILATKHAAILRKITNILSLLHRLCSASWDASVFIATYKFSPEYLNARQIILKNHGRLKFDGEVDNVPAPTDKDAAAKEAEKEEKKKKKKKKQRIEYFDDNYSSYDSQGSYSARSDSQDSRRPRRTVKRKPKSKANKKRIDRLKSTLGQDQKGLMEALQNRADLKEIIKEERKTFIQNMEKLVVKHGLDGPVAPVGDMEYMGTVVLNEACSNIGKVTSTTPNIDDYKVYTRVLDDHPHKLCKRPLANPNRAQIVTRTDNVGKEPIILHMLQLCCYSKISSIRKLAVMTLLAMITDAPKDNVNLTALQDEVLQNPEPSTQLVNGYELVVPYIVRNFQRAHIGFATRALIQLFCPVDIELRSLVFEFVDVLIRTVHLPRMGTLRRSLIGTILPTGSVIYQLSNMVTTDSVDILGTLVEMADESVIRLLNKTTVPFVLLEGRNGPRKKVAINALLRMLYIDDFEARPAPWHMQVLRILLNLVHDTIVRDEIVETMQNSRVFREAMQGIEYQ